MKLPWNFRRLRNDVDDEITAHIEEKTAELIDAGLGPQEARLRARREFGNVGLIAETSRGVWAWTWFERLMQDLRYAVRMLARTPGFTTVAVLSLALGIGANTAIFGLLDVLLFRMLPIERPEELKLVSVRWNPSDKPGVSISYPCFRMMRDANRGLRELAASATFQWRDKSVSGDGAWHNGQMVSGNYFSVLGVGAAWGRVLGPEDDRVEGTGRSDAIPAVLNYSYWRRAFDSDPGVLGRQVNLNGAWATVVGVAAPEFFGTIVGISPDVFVPVLAQPSVSPPNNLLHDSPTVSNSWIIGFGRLMPGVSEPQAQTELTVAAQQYQMTRRGPGDRDKALTARVVLEPGSRGLSRLRERFSEPLKIVMALVGIVLLIACANLANLMLARTAARRKEIAVRLAIGASRSRIVRQLLTESVLLSVLGGAAGLGFALWSGGLLVRMLPPAPVPYSVALAPDARLLAFTFGLATITGLLFGIAPALRETRSLNESMKRGRRFDLSRALVVIQIALAAPLVVGAGLFIGTLRNLVTLDAGFLRQNVIQVTINPDGARYPREQWPALYDRVLEQVLAVPGVRAASLANRGLMQEGVTASGPLGVPGYIFRPGERQSLPETYVSGDYFVAAGIPLRLGRLFTAREEEGKSHVAVVNETMAQRYFAGRNPIGLSYSLGRSPGETYLEIVGVVADAKYNDLRQEPTPMAYYPWRQVGVPRLYGVVVRTQGDAAAIAPALRQAIGSIHPDLYFQSRTLTAQIDETLVRERMLARLSGFLGVLALLVACVGLYGVLSYGVTRRTAEIGVRIALGARPSEVAALVLRQTAGVVAIGLVFGVGLSLALTWLTESFLYGVKPNDPVVMAAAAFALAAVSLAAAYLPARRAASVDPLIALRHE